MLCEGKHDAAFFRHLIIQHGLPSFQVLDLSQLTAGGGTGHWLRALNAVMTLPGLDALRSLLIVGDNDDQPAARFAQICDAVRDSQPRPGPPLLKLSAPTAVRQKGTGTPTVAVLMVPWDGVNGELATLCYQAVSNADAVKAGCVDAYATCVGTPGWPAAKIAKLKLSAYLATYRLNPFIPFHCVWDEPIPPIPLTDPAYNQVINFLRNYEAFLAA